jgi:hypothetical protein
MAPAFLIRCAAFLSCLALCGCSIFHEDVGSRSATVQTSLLPASVPYYLDLCGQSENAAEYALIAPGNLERWLKKPAEAAAKRQACAKERRIENGDPITVRLHRVGIGGLSDFDKKGNCTKGCRRDVAIVIDFNGSDVLQKPIVAFYQRNVTPDANLQFTNFTIYTQNEWFYRYPPSVRVRLYDVRTDKDQELRTQLDTIARSKDQILSFVAGATIAGPLVDTAIDVAKKLTSGPRNRPILDMAFQLFPQEQDAGGDAQEGRRQQSAAALAAKQQQQQPSSDPLTVDEIKALQTKYNAEDGADGKFGPKTKAALEKANVGLAADKAGTPEYARQARTLLSATTTTSASADRQNDWTFGAPIFASQFIVFNEDARPIGNCDPAWTNEAEQRRANLGRSLPAFSFVPDGARHGGARVYGKRIDAEKSGKECMLESPYVVFSITRESAAVAVDVAKRISDLQAKFTASAAVSEDSVTSLGAAMVDAELALAIDRLENGRKADQLLGLISRLRDRYKEKSVNPNGLPLPSATFRSRAFRLIGDYTGCTVADSVDAGFLDSLLTGLKTLDLGLKRENGWQKPYFADRLPSGFTCPAQLTIPAQAPASLPAAVPAETTNGQGAQPQPQPAQPVPAQPAQPGQPGTGAPAPNAGSQLGTTTENGVTSN